MRRENLHLVSYGRKRICDLPINISYYSSEKVMSYLCKVTPLPFKKLSSVLIFVQLPYFHQTMLNLNYHKFIIFI